VIGVKDRLLDKAFNMVVLYEVIDAISFSSCAHKSSES
jgi:hypothetical protein